MSSEDRLLLKAFAEACSRLLRSLAVTCSFSDDQSPTFRNSLKFLCEHRLSLSQIRSYGAEGSSLAIATKCHPRPRAQDHPVCCEQKLNFIIFSAPVLLRRGAESSTVELSCPSVVNPPWEQKISSLSSSCNVFKIAYSLVISVLLSLENQLKPTLSSISFFLSEPPDPLTLIRSYFLSTISNFSKIQTASL